MSLPLPTNRSFSCANRSLTGLKALLLPASDQDVIMQGAAVGKLFNITFNDLFLTLKDGDLLTNEADTTETYRIRGVKHVQSPQAAHTHALAESGLT